MALSRRWKALKREITALRKQFLPEPFDPLGSYQNGGAVRTNTRAFLVLSHAEVETYVEEWAKEIARASEEVWKTKGKVTTPLAYLFATLVQQLSDSSRDPPADLSAACVRMFQSFYKRIKDNHGIKEDNVLGLYSPLGIPAAAMGSTLLPNLNSFGDLRGAHAHHSGRAVQNALDPETEFNNLAGILEDLKAFDLWLSSYKRKIR